MRVIDRRLGVALALLAAFVFWSARSFPAVPGQKVGAGFLPMLVAVGLLACGLALAWRSYRGHYDEGQANDAPAQQVAAALGVVATVVAYILLADRLGFLLLAPVCLAVVFRILGVSWRATLLWALGGTLLVHLAFYKLLRVPLPWGVLRPFY